MPLGRMIFFAIWLALALLGGALIVWGWQRLRAKYPVNETAPPKPAGDADHSRRP